MYEVYATYRPVSGHIKRHETWLARLEPAGNAEGWSFLTDLGWTICVPYAAVESFGWREKKQ